jgi:large subunit ribosomal protein L4
MKVKIPYFNNQGERLEDLSLDISDNFAKLNTKLVSQAVYVEASKINQKAGQTKTRAQVRGGGKKPWRQKGTGRARAGSIRSPLWRGGGIIFGPSNKVNKLDLPQKMRKIAKLQVISKIIREKQIVVLDNLKLNKEKTKEAIKLLTKIIPLRQTILVFDDDEVENILAFRNIPLLECISLSHLILRDLIAGRFLIFSQKSFEKIAKYLRKND